VAEKNTDCLGTGFHVFRELSLRWRKRWLAGECLCKRMPNYYSSAFETQFGVNFGYVLYYCLSTISERKINKNPLGTIVAGEQSAELGNNVILDLGKLLVSALQIPGLTLEIYLSLLILIWH
jgi:hypothetical protein